VTIPDRRIITDIDSSTPIGQTLEKFGALLDEAFAFGTHVFCWCNDGSAGRREDEGQPMLLLRHFLELLDCLPHLIRLGISDPCAPTLRAMFEAVIAVEYLVQPSEDKRGYAFLVCEVRRRLAVIDSVDLQTEAGRQARETIRKDKFLGDYEHPQVDDLDARRQPNLELLQMVGFSEANQEFERLRKQKGRVPKWHEFYNGPRTLKQLSTAVGLAGWYEIHYRRWSGTVHASHITEGRLILAGGGPAYLALRDPREAQMVVSTALSLAFQVYSAALRVFATSRLDDFQRWYAESMKVGYTAVSGERIIQVKGE